MVRSLALATLVLFVGTATGCGDDSGAPPEGSGDSTGGTVTSTGADEPTSTGAATTSGADASTTGTTGSGSSFGDATTGTDDGLTTDTGEPSTPRVLFLGNSYTQSNAMTDMVGAMADGIGAPLEIVAITQGGATVADLLARADVQAALDEEAWDFVVIQGQSYEPLIQPLVFEEAALQLAALATDAGAVPVPFETWARIEGHALYDEPFSGGDPAAMQALLHAAYSTVAEQSGGTLAPVGQAWALSLTGSPSIVLHAADGSHPSVAGSYLAAAVFHGVMQRSPATGNAWWPPQLSPDDAMALQAHADAAVAARSP